MKKNDLKNNIAFTLTEMTLVLLITSVIAATATPIITSKVSDAASKGGPNSVEITDNPWKAALGYNGGGIYNNPVTNTSFISIGQVPNASSESYYYPALLLNSSSVNNFIQAPQISILPLGNISNSNNYQVYSIISMDAFENIAMVYGSDSFKNLKSSTATRTIGERSIYIGDYIQNLTAARKINADKSIFMGYAINAENATYAINIGSNITRKSTEQNTINIGSNLYSTATNYNILNSINIGNYAAYNGNGRENVIMGNFAGYDSDVYHNVILGSYAGYRLKSGSDYDNADNIIIGRFASYFSNKPNIGIGNNIIIGNYAGSESGSGLTGKGGNIFIGEHASQYNVANNTSHAFQNTISIGSFSNYITDSNSGSENEILIGNYAGANRKPTTKTYNNIFIGDEAAKGSKMTGSIAIGSSVGQYTDNDTSKAYGNILIGANAGYSSQGARNIFIGSLAGYNTKSASGLYNVGIGSSACAEMNGSPNPSEKWCIGSGTLPNISYSGTSVWSRTGNNPQMVIGFTRRTTYTGQTIVLYAAHVYRPGSYAYLNRISDRRYKTDIVPSTRSIKDIRKINIYDYNFKNDEKKTPKIGVIAQEYKRIFPYDVSREPRTKKLAVSADWLIYTMVNATKDVDNEIKNLQKQMNEYVADFMGLKSKVAKLEKQAEQIKLQNAQMRAHLAKINEKLK